jgi:hypothetical protein
MKSPIRWIDLGGKSRLPSSSRSPMRRPVASQSCPRHGPRQATRSAFPCMALNCSSPPTAGTDLVECGEAHVGLELRPAARTTRVPTAVACAAAVSSSTVLPTPESPDSRSAPPPTADWSTNARRKPTSLSRPLSAPAEWPVGIRSTGEAKVAPSRSKRPYARDLPERVPRSSPHRLVASSATPGVNWGNSVRCGAVGGEWTGRAGFTRQRSQVQNLPRPPWSEP